jgi:hypothetical protein
MRSLKFDSDEGRFKKSKEPAPDGVHRGIWEKLATIHCPTHGASPTVEFAGESAEEVKYRIHACCQPTLEAAEASLHT